MPFPGDEGNRQEMYSSLLPSQPGAPSPPSDPLGISCNPPFLLTARKSWAGCHKGPDKSLQKHTTILILMLYSQPAHTLRRQRKIFQSSGCSSTGTGVLNPNRCLHKHQSWVSLCLSLGKRNTLYFRLPMDCSKVAFSAWRKAVRCLLGAFFSAWWSACII